MINQETKAKSLSIVTGAGSGIGKEIARELYNLGHKLLLIDIDEINLEKTSKELSALSLVLDLTKIKSLEILKDYIIKNNLILDWVVNNAGIGLKGKFYELSYEEQEKIIGLNCRAPIFLTHFALNQFCIHRNRGTLINIISSSAFQPLPSMAVYTAS